ncbi:MAG: hypothetical protein PUA95_06980 [Lactimicrobium massiliense]|nr:DUF6591 domain-containing protein [Lactimicrobium massiliense]MDD6230460.1 hypothetical protein [Lactimicrobium massiliense]
MKAVKQIMILVGLSCTLTAGCGKKADTAALASPAENTPLAQVTVQPAAMTPASQNGETVSPELKEFLDSYEAFVDEYVAFMQQYNENPSDAAMAESYAQYMQKYAEFAQKANVYADQEGEMSTADENYLIEVMARISIKLNQAAVNADQTNG